MFEFAAKAAGLHDDWPEPDYGVQWNGNAMWCFGMGHGMLWNPRDDDGDALRLAVKLGLIVDSHGMYARACFPYEAPLAYEAMREDRCAATRRAITRAAAEIGRNMP